MKCNRIIAKMVSAALIAGCVTLCGCGEYEHKEEKNTIKGWVVIDYGDESVLHASYDHVPYIVPLGALNYGDCYTCCCGTIQNVHRSAVIQYSSKPIEASYNSVCPNLQRMLNEEASKTTQDEETTELIK